MSFVDIRFLIFFPTVLVLHILTPPRFRWILLLIASYLFYMAWKPSYGLLLLGITVIDYVAGLLIARSTKSTQRKIFLIISLAANLGILFFFKYFNFFFDTLGQATHALGLAASFPLLSILVPIGISFHVFQSMSYTIDVYTGKAQPVRHFGKFALYVSFFPQLVAGPIERPSGLLQQFFEDRPFSLEKAQRGALLMLWGFYKKVGIADNLAPVVNAIYANPTLYPGPSLIIGAVLFSYQLYCDFSGYTDIARGAALMLGYDLVENFNRPYIAISIADFWRRWHISLSSWLRDYMYLPLAFGGKRLSKMRIYVSMFVTFTLIGLWHGANWTFVVMGALFGTYMIVGSLTEQWRKRVLNTPAWFKRLITFSLVTFAWIFFRAQTLTSALYIASHLTSGIPTFISNFGWHVLAADAPIFTTAVGVLGIGIVASGEALHERGVFTRFKTLPSSIQISLYGAALFALLIVGAFTSSQSFIYFRF